MNEVKKREECNDREISKEVRKQCAWYLHGTVILGKVFVISEL